MKAITLYKIVPEEKMFRFYFLDIQPDLFGNSCLVRKWGRKGTTGQSKVIPYENMEAAKTVFELLYQVKQKKGYREAFMIS